MKRSIILLFLLLVPIALAAPVAYITESATADYYSNGTIEGFGGTGYIEVGVGNTVDVLQFLRLNLSTTEGTNLQSDEAYRAVAASPNISDRTRIYVSTNNSLQDVSYNTTDSSRALIKLKLDYENLLGGSDISSNDTNYFIFNLTLNFTADLSNINLTLQLAKDTYNTADSMNITGATATQGTAVINDTDSDGYYDKIIWNGSLSNEAAVISFNASIKSNINFNETDLYISLDPLYGVLSSATANSTTTGINFTNLFSRGPIREGIDLHDLGNGIWKIRGFLKNIANGLNYTVAGWGLYEVSDLQNSVLSSTESYMLKPNDLMYTGVYTKSIAAKPYYATAFDWEVNWNSPVYQSNSIARMILPTLYELDIWVDKTVSLVSNTLGGRTLKIADLVRHLGNSNIGVNGVIINSIIPKQSSNNWQIGDVEVYYVNSSGTYGITNSVSVTTSNPSSSSDGYVLLNITNITSVLNHTLKLNEDIRLNYTISSSVSSVNQNFTFYSNLTMITESGTPVTRSSSDTINISGIEAPEEPEVPTVPSVGGGVPAKLKIEIIKEVADISLVEENIAKVIIVDKIRDNGLRGAEDVKAFIYAPIAAELDVSSISVELYGNELESWKELKHDIDFLVVDEGIVNIGGKRYKSNLIKKKKGEWHLYNGDKIKISYKIKLPYGTHYILTRVSGYDGYNRKTVFEDSYTPIRVVKEILKIPLEIKEIDFEQVGGRVGKAVTWVKTIEIYNPNDADVTETLSTLIFPDALNAYLTEEGIRKQIELAREGDSLIVSWEDKIKALEKRLYVLKVTTPPVIEVKRETGILQSNETIAIFIVNSTIKNTALEDYIDIYYPLPVIRDKVIKVEYEGKEVNYTIGFNIPLIKAGETKKIVIVYEEKIPTLVIFIDKDFYKCSDRELNFTAFIIPDEKSKNYYLELEIVSSNKENVFADIDPIKELEAGKEFKISKELKLDFIYTGEHKVIAKLRKDFLTLLIGYNVFNVEKEEVTYCVLPKRINILLLILMVFIVIAIVSIGKYWVTKSYRKQEKKGKLIGKIRYLIQNSRRKKKK